MPERLRALAERPLDPCVARAILVLACAVLAGLAALFALAGDEQGPSERPSATAARPAASALAPVSRLVNPPVTSHQRRRRSKQDPQDRPGSAAARRAVRELTGHRALQHVPYRRGSVAVSLVGARSGRAVLRVSAPTLGAAQREWRVFLRRYRDDGRAYVPSFRTTRGNRG